jgi:hypothetical protein
MATHVTLALIGRIPHLLVLVKVFNPISLHRTGGEHITSDFNCICVFFFLFFLDNERALKRELMISLYLVFPLL